MKKNLFIFLLFACVFAIYGQTNYLFNYSAFPIYKKDDVFIGIFTRPLPKSQQTPWKWDEKYEVYFTDKTFTIENGWKRLNRPCKEFSSYKDDNQYDTPYFIEGGGIALFLDSNICFEEANFRIDRKAYLSSVRNTVEIIDSLDYKTYLKEKSVKEHSSISEIHNKVNIISASSFYTERLKNDVCLYDTRMLKILLNSENGHSCWISHNPWVPGKNNNSSGIGEYLEIDFSKPSNNLVILNGYVEPFKHYLYKANNRVRKAVITSLDEEKPFEFEYDFEDYVHFSEIIFPKAVNKVRFTIKEVYKGEKWDDTCIQAVITRWED